MKRPTVGIVTSNLELALMVTGALPLDVETHTHLSWDDHGIDAYACDLTLIGADLAHQSPVRAVTSTVHIIGPDRATLPAGILTDAATIGASSVLVLSDPEDRARLWRLAYGLPATTGGGT